MPVPPAYHPAVRENCQPRVSATALAEYLIVHCDRQETILHDSRYSRPPIVTANGDALRALCAYNADMRRDSSALERVKAALITKAKSSDFKPKTRDEARRCAEAINLFQRCENALGMRHMALREAGRFAPISIEGCLSPYSLICLSMATRPYWSGHSACCKST